MQRYGTYRDASQFGAVRVSDAESAQLQRTASVRCATRITSREGTFIAKNRAVWVTPGESPDQPRAIHAMEEV